MKNKLPKVSVVMSNYNGYTLKLIPHCLESILNNTYPNLEVIFVDNASTDKSVEKIQKLSEDDERNSSSKRKLKIIRNHINMYSLGLNLGIKNSSGKYIAFFNNDVFVKNGFFQELVNYLEKNPNIALIQGKLLSYFNNEIIDSVGETMDEFGNPITIGAGKEAESNFNEIAEVLSVSGSCSIIRRSVIEKIGYFDDDYGIGYEDMDIALRSWMAGYKVVYYPKALAFHKRAVTDTSKMVRALVRWHFNKNRIATLLKNYPVSFLLRNLPVTLVIYFLAGTWEIFIKRDAIMGLTRFTSILWILDHIFAVLRKRSYIQKNVSKKGAEKIQQLLYKNTLLQSFGSFVKVK